jgi:hypothetical protein
LRFIISAEKIRIISKKKTSPLVKYFATAFSGVIAALLISGFVSQVYASDLNAFLVPSRATSEASYIGIKSVELRYPSGSSLAQEFNGKNERVQFEMNLTSDEHAALVNNINRAYANVQSPVQVSSAEISYSSVLRGGPTSTQISYRVEIIPIMQQYVLATEGGQHIVDLEWRGIVIEEPMVVNAPDVGEIDINHPIGLLQATHPTVAEQFENTPAMQVLEDPILNFEDFNDAPMSSWQFLFDPVGAYGGSVELQGTEGASVLSVYALGESSLREGTHTATERDVDVTIDGAPIQVHSTTPPPSGQITIAGYAEDRETEGTEFALVSAEAPAGAATATGGFPIQVLLVLGGMMGAVAIFVLLKARK